MPVVLSGVAETELDLDAHLAAVENTRAGATAAFVGTVRDHDPQIEGQVVLLSYSAHPDAPDIIHRIAQQVLDVHDPDGVARLAVTHRVGDLRVGEKAIIVAVSAPHRDLAFRVCEEVVEEIKRSLPIWKKQHNAGGETAWSGLK